MAIYNIPNGVNIKDMSPDPYTNNYILAIASGENKLATKDGVNWEYVQEIKGKLLVATLKQPNFSIPNNSDEASWKEHVKKTLAHELARQIIDEYAEFTISKDPDYDVTVYKARCFLVTTDQVKFLRVNHLLNKNK